MQIQSVTIALKVKQHEVTAYSFTQTLLDTQLNMSIENVTILVQIQ